MASQSWLHAGGRTEGAERSDWEFSMSDSDDSDSDDDNTVDGLSAPATRKTSREMTLGGLIFNSSQFTANAVLEQSLGKLLSNQGVVNSTSADTSPKAKASTKRTMLPKSFERSPTALKEHFMSAAHPFELKRVTSTSAMEMMKAKLEKHDAGTDYQYETEMNVEDIMAMRNLTKEHGARNLTKTKSLSAPDLCSPSFLAGFKQLDELGEGDESAGSEDEGESPTPKHRRPVTSDYAKTNPDDFLKFVVKETFGTCPEKVPSSEIPDYFLQITPEMISSYDMDVATAVRNEDMRVLSRMQRKGKPLQCCNRFGESIVHTVCRRGSTKLLQFLLDRANVSMKVMCDYGRTPLHDACWTRAPNFEMIAIVVEECPDFLWMTDKRGFTPLNYVQKDQWGIWCVFLEEHKLLLKPKVVV
jgi:hypothetical protein